VLGTTETKQALVKNGSSRSWVTIIDAITATGKYLNPEIIVEYHKPYTHWFGVDYLFCFDWRVKEDLPEMEKGRRASEGVIWRALFLDGFAGHYSRGRNLCPPV
jgi:hypothetical protein